MDSEISEASTLVSTCSDKEADKGKGRISHQAIRGALSDSEMETTVSACCLCVYVCVPSPVGKLVFLCVCMSALCVCVHSPVGKLV